MRVALIAAIAKNRVIGKEGKLPWHIPEDLKRFKQRTLHHPVVMGRKTFESLQHPLPQRRTIVITSHRIPSVETYRSLEEALDVLRDEKIVFIIGGSLLFREALPLATDLYFTLLSFDAEGDVVFPEYEEFVKEHFTLATEETTNFGKYVHYVRRTP